MADENDLDTIARLEREIRMLKVQLLTVTKDMTNLVALFHVVLHKGNPGKEPYT